MREKLYKGAQNSIAHIRLLGIVVTCRSSLFLRALQCLIVMAFRAMCHSHQRRTPSDAAAEMPTRASKLHAFCSGMLHLPLPVLHQEYVRNPLLLPVLLACALIY